MSHKRQGNPFFTLINETEPKKFGSLIAWNELIFLSWGVQFVKRWVKRKKTTRWN